MKHSAMILVMLAAAAADAADRPDVVLILSDDMGFSDLGCFGGEAKTPVLDRLARAGLRFTQFYNTARCCPTRASLLTGLYPHQAGVGHMLAETGLPGYTSGLNRQSMTIAEVLRTAGYRTYMTGKWHVTSQTRLATEEGKANWPLQRGFERFFGTIHGGGSYYDPTSLTRDNKLIAPDAPGFYYTDAISSNAAQYVRDHARDHAKEPFFMYVAYTAAHWPMHALLEDIRKYDGVYDCGWDAIRQARYRRVKELGLIDPGWAMTPRDPKSPAWEDAPDKEWEIALMQVYTAMIDRMDQGIGQIVAALEDTGRFDNTLILFLQDNGGCAEPMGRGDTITYKADREKIEPMEPGELQTEMIPPRTRDGKPTRQGRGVMPGPADTFLGYGLSWANASNTPFREYKHWVHEGGIATPLVAHWPRGIAAERRGTLERQPGHLVDIMATCADLAGAEYPKVYRGQAIAPLEGVSLRPAFAGRSLERSRPIFWEHEANSAVRDGKWKLVRKGNMNTGQTAEWELYDMEADRTELNDLAAKMPERAQAMAQAWEAWAVRAQVKPWPWGRNKTATKKGNNKKVFELAAGASLPQEEAPQTGRRPLSIVASLAAPGEGVIVAQGGVTHGYSLFVKDGKPAFAMRHQAKMTVIGGSSPLPQGASVIRVRLAVSGETVLEVNGAEVAKVKAPGPIATPVDGLTVGRDGGDPVGPYTGPEVFQGKLEKVVIRLDSGGEDSASEKPTTKNTKS